MMIASVVGVLLVILSPTQKVERVERVNPVAFTVVEVPYAVTSAVTDFECMDVGPFDDPCWTVNEVKTCAEAVGSSLEFVDTDVPFMGSRSLAWVEKCLSDETPAIRLRFSPPVTWVQMSIASLPMVGMEERHLSCWFGWTDDAVDLDENDPLWQFDPPDYLSIDSAWSLGLTVSCGSDCGIVACEVRSGHADNLTATTLGISTGP